MYEASRRNGVPLWVLLGVKLAETGAGVSDQVVSSAGALGAFGIEPATAESLHVNPGNFNEAADGAARLLASYKKEYGTWGHALEAYNAGPATVGQGTGYNQQWIEHKLKEFGTSKSQIVRLERKLDRLPEGSVVPADLWNFLGHLPLIESLNPENWLKKNPAETPPGKEVPRVEGGVLGGLEGLSALVNALTNVDTWLRIGEVIAGAILVYMGLKSLTGVGLSDVPGARHVPIPVPV